ncbi:hypothetical protein DLAC_05987 [Tieghemostelium lacteum]|uniref:Transmembrane protein n=1 Tax=Tieghemostelium lacteum TaxID=361077 RepID=A0A151ZHD3_TIELA|nr:hypothetical protein DLAC_05987 [Tieghemostelium lacteum]|eukprot:KYQ93319.1 hypothetical protein DLAC_05987 [Tieghemostelium lacteum]
MSNELELAQTKVISILYPRTRTLEDMVLTGFKNGGIAGIGIGLVIPIIFRGRVSPMQAFVKSVANTTFIGCTYMGCRYFIDNKLLFPPINSSIVSGALTGGFISGIFSLRNAPLGFFMGGIIGFIGYTGYKMSGYESKEAIEDIQTLRILVEKYPELTLTDRDRNIYNQLIAGVDKRILKDQEPFSFTRFLSSLNPLKELTEAEKQELLKSKDTIYVDLKNKDRDNSLKLGIHQQKPTTPNDHESSNKPK